MIKLKVRKVWDWMGIPGVIITSDPVVLTAIATSSDPEHVEILTVFVPLFPEPWLCGWTGYHSADTARQSRSP